MLVVFRHEFRGMPLHAENAVAADDAPWCPVEFSTTDQTLDRDIDLSGFTRRAIEIASVATQFLLREQAVGVIR